MRNRIESTGFLAGTAVGTVSLALYLTTLAPTISWGSDGKAVDGAELLTAANVLGIPHPPGYPTYTLLLKAFTYLVPIGDYAFKGNLLSAVLATLTTVLLFAATARLCRITSPNQPVWIANISSALSSLVLATSPLFWSQSVITEVYTLNTLFLASLLLISSGVALRAKLQIPHRTEHKLFMFTILLGLGLGNHVTLIVFAIPLVYWMGQILGWKQIVSPKLLAGLAIGLAIYVYLPIRSAQTPIINWGHPHSISGLMWMLTARPYQDYAFNIPLVSLIPRVVEWTNLIFSQFNPLGIFLGLVGARRLFINVRGFFLPALVATTIISIYSLTYSTIDFEVLMIPAFLLFSSWIGVGFFWISTSWIPNSYQPNTSGSFLNKTMIQVTTLSILGFLLLPVVSITLNFGTQNMSDDRTAYTHAAEMMDLVPDGSTVISNREKNVFTLWYMSYVEMPERDVAIIAAPLLEFDWYLEDVHRMFPDRIPAMSKVTFKEAASHIMAHNRGRSKVFFTFINSDISNAYDLKRIGDVYQARIK